MKRSNGPLFDNPIVHTDDPDPSHVAAEVVESSGRRAIHMEMVYRAVVRLPDATAPELAVEAGMGEYQVRRRLTDLQFGGRIVRSGQRDCKVKRTLHSTWRKR